MRWVLTLALAGAPRLNQPGRPAVEAPLHALSRRTNASEDQDANASRLVASEEQNASGAQDTNASRLVASEEEQNASRPAASPGAAVAPQYREAKRSVVRERRVLGEPPGVLSREDAVGRVHLEVGPEGVEPRSRPRLQADVLEASGAPGERVVAAPAPARSASLAEVAAGLGRASAAAAAAGQHLVGAAGVKVCGGAVGTALMAGLVWVVTHCCGHKVCRSWTCVKQLRLKLGLDATSDCTLKVTVLKGTELEPASGAFLVAVLPRQGKCTKAADLGPSHKTTPTTDLTWNQTLRVPVRQGFNSLQVAVYKQELFGPPKLYGWAILRMQDLVGKKSTPCVNKWVALALPDAGDSTTSLPRRAGGVLLTIAKSGDKTHKAAKDGDRAAGEPSDDDPDRGPNKKPMAKSGPKRQIRG